MKVQKNIFLNYLIAQSLNNDVSHAGRISVSRTCTYVVRTLRYNDLVDTDYLIAGNSHDIFVLSHESIQIYDSVGTRV